MVDRPESGKSGEDAGTDGKPIPSLARVRARSAPHWQQDYLDNVRRHGDRVRAAAEVGVKPKTVSNHLSADPDFRAALEAAQRQAESVPLVEKLEWVEPFIRALRGGGSLRFAARASGVDTTTVYRYMRADVDFRDQVKIAREDAFDALEFAARQRALGGSDRLMELLLKAGKPEVYGDTLRFGRLLEKESQTVYDEAIAEGLDHETALVAVDNFQRMLGAPTGVIDV